MSEKQYPSIIYTGQTQKYFSDYHSLPANIKAIYKEYQKLELTEWATIMCKVAVKHGCDESNMKNPSERVVMLELEKQITNRKMWRKLEVAKQENLRKWQNLFFKEIKKYGYDLVEFDKFGVERVVKLDNEGVKSIQHMNA